MRIRNIKILFIEDDPIEQKKFSKVISLHTRKYEVVLSGRDNISVLIPKTFLPDVILLDLDRKAEKDLEFLKKIKSDINLKQTPIIILTKSKNQKYIKKYFDIGISGCILKPIKEEEYIEKIEIILQYWDINELKK